MTATFTRRLFFRFITVILWPDNEYQVCRPGGALPRKVLTNKAPGAHGVNTVEMDT